jgi:DNA-binding CsgD family transcriptional regulator
VESEVPLEFVGLADLLEAAPSSAFDQLPALQRSALGIAVFREEISEFPVDPHTLASAVLNALRALSATAPVVLAIDDLPWLDPPSARVLSFVLRRVGTAPIGLVGTVRTEWAATPSLATDVMAAVPADRLTVGPLELAEIRDLVISRTSTTPSRSKMARIEELSQGNPLFALELAGAPDTDPTQGETAGLPVSLSHLVLERLQTLPTETREVVLLSALTTAPTMNVIRAAALNSATAPDDLDLAEREGILRRQGENITFSHPLIRSVTVADASSRQRRFAHERLARVIGDREQRARHLAFATTQPDEQTAWEVEQAAEVAAARGACDTATSLARLAVRLTPEERVDELRRRTSLEADYCFVIGDTTRACTLLEAIVDGMPAGPARAELLRRLARYLTHRGDPISTWAARLGMALDESGDDLNLRASILVDAIFATSYVDDLAASDLYTELALDAVEAAGDQVLAAQLNAALARTALVRGEGVRQDLIERALRGPDPPVRLAVEMRPNVVIGHILRLAGDLDTARGLYEEEDARARREGVEVGLPLILGGLVQTETAAGNWDRAERLGIEATERALDSNSLLAQSYVASATALLWVCQGKIEEGRSDAQRAVELARAVGMPVFQQYAAEAVGLAELSIGDPAAAHRCLEPFVSLPYCRDFREPSLLRFVPDDVEALIRLGDLAAAIDLLEPFETRSIELGRVAEMVASGRCRGLLLAARGKLDEAVVTLERAVELQAALTNPFERGRTLLLAGEIHRRARHKALAKTSLELALTIFRQLGAPLWAERAQEEINRLGLRRRPSSSELTVNEQRVADLAASGLTNSEIAARLFLSPRTVEAHLSRIYRKLGVKSRTAMSRAHLAGSGRVESEHVESERPMPSVP